MAKVILISQFPLPYSKIGSWTTMYKNYLESFNLIDYVVCVEPNDVLDRVVYQFVPQKIIKRIIKKLKNKPYFNYLKAIELLLKKDEKYIIQIVDNFGIIKDLDFFLKQRGLRQNCYLQFFYHGFSPFYGNFDGKFFYETIDEMVLLTYDSYIAHKNYYTVLPTRFSVLHNGIDTKKFSKVSIEEKSSLKQQFDVTDKKVFIWCSQDRPKKGLHMVLDAWKRVYSKNKNIVLWVIGVERNDLIEGVVFKGKIPNEQLPKYYQTADCYLFSTLWHEGFGLSLIEALHCGCYCIASSLGGVQEVLQYGKYGKLVENPHFVFAWEQAILEFIYDPVSFESITTDLYSSENWNLGMNAIIENAKEVL
jgi:glycosyltransferase involved in cell wall biosynthesis